MTAYQSPFSDSAISRTFVDSPFGQFHVRCSRGSPETQVPLVLLHASPASSLPLVPLIKQIGLYRPCFAPDTLGFGDSDPPPKLDPEAEDYADWVMSAIKAMGIDEFHLYGSHTGAHIAVELSLKYPVNVRRLILDGIAMFSNEEKKLMLERYAPAKFPDESGSQFNWAWHFVRDQALFFPYFDKRPVACRHVAFPDSQQLHAITVDVLKSLETYHLGYRAAFSHKDRERLPRIGHKTLVTAEETDPLHKNAHLAAELIPDCELWISSASRHDARAGVFNTFLDSGKMYLNDL